MIYPPKELRDVLVFKDIGEISLKANATPKQKELFKQFIAQLNSDQNGKIEYK